MNNETHVDASQSSNIVARGYDPVRPYPCEAGYAASNDYSLTLLEMVIRVTNIIVYLGSIGLIQYGFPENPFRVTLTLYYLVCV